MKKRILFLSQQFPYPLTDGGNIRTFKVLEGLSRRYEVCLIAAVCRGVTPEASLESVRGVCAEAVCVPDVKSRRWHALTAVFLRGLFKRMPMACAYNFNSNIQREFSSRIATGKVWAVHLNHLDSVQYALPGRINFPKAIIDTHNLLFQFYFKIAKVEQSWLKKNLLRLEAKRTKNYELRVLQSATQVLVCSELERKRLREEGVHKNVWVVPNGVDCAYFHPPESGYTRNPPVVVFTAAMGYGPNSDATVYFIKDVMPLLREKVPGIRFVAVGKEPPISLMDLANQFSDVLITGKVADVRSFVWDAKVFVIPIRKGAGTRLKVLEAFAMGIPAVSTSLGAEGIEYTVDRELLIGDNTASMAQHIIRLMTDPTLYAGLSARSVELARRKYDWKLLIDQLLEVYGN